MTMTSSKLHVSHLTANEEALVRCETALKLKDKGDSCGVQKVMLPLWSRVGERPAVEDLHPSVAAEVLLCVGTLTCWIGSKTQMKTVQDLAKDLIGESIRFFEGAADVKKVAAARAELAYCYWCEGALGEARIMFEESLQKLTAEGNTRARALLGLAVVEWSASQYSLALRILTDSAPLFKKITNHSIKGAYHSQVAMILRMLATSGNTNDYLQRAVSEYQEADYNFKIAQNTIFRADVKNLLRQLGRFREAHKYLEEARRLTQTLRDKLRTAQIDDTRAQVFIAEKKYKEAVGVAKMAVRVLEKSGHQCLLTDALITQGIALARLEQTDHAQFIFQKAIEVAHQVGALNKAGIAALTLIEELDELSAETLYAAYDCASEWLAKSQSQDLLLRVNAAGRKVFSRLRGETKTEAVTIEDPFDTILNKPCDLQNEVLKFEGTLIQRALAKANGSLTRAAALLSMSYQALAYILESRQKYLLKERSPIRRRSRKDLSAENAEQS